MTTNRSRTRIIKVWFGMRSLSRSFGSFYSPRPKTITIIVVIILGALSVSCSCEIGEGYEKSVIHFTIIR